MSPLPISTQTPYGIPKHTPNVDTDLSSRLSFETQKKGLELKNETQKRDDEYALAVSNFDSNKLSAANFMGVMDDLIGRAPSSQEKNKWTIYKQTNQNNIIQNKLSTEYNNILKKIADESISPKEAYNSITQLGVQAAVIDEGLASQYFLKASVQMNAMTKAGEGSNTLFNNWVNEIG